MHKKPSLTLKEIIFDIKPTIQWNIFEHFFFKFMPNLERLMIKNVNLRSKSCCLHFAQIFRQYLTNLNYLSIVINLHHKSNFIIDNEQYQRYYPLFKFI